MADTEDLGKQNFPILKSLSPKYNADYHKKYVCTLAHTIKTEPTVRNIALAGSYGVGKSSILEGFRSKFTSRVLSISLLSLGTEQGSDDDSKDSDTKATSNRIQKEIVKQLLYQQSPKKSSESRFRRITRFRWPSEITLAVIAGLAVFILLLAIGVDFSASNLSGAWSNVPHWLRTVSAYLSVPLVVGIVVLIVRLLIRGRFTVEKLSAGPATIALPSRSTSYFDEYLDEIIYSFETMKKIDIVIFEDLDRFENAEIFESLRSLNNLLNVAAQLGSRNFRFIYATRDSIFEPTQKNSKLSYVDSAQTELERANRTKFFELVIPVVPFISHENARDLMYKRLSSDGVEISTELVELTAKHVADMRLIHNIVNEYQVFATELLKGPNRVPDLDAERLFAVIVFKNTHLKEFENIRYGESSLDCLYREGRALVSRELGASRVAIQEYQERIRLNTRAHELAADWMDRLRDLMTSFAAGQRVTFLYNGQEDDEYLSTPEFWQDFLGSDSDITVSFGRSSLTITPKTARRLIGPEMGAANSVTGTTDFDQEQIEIERANIKELRGSTWQDLYERHDYVPGRNWLTSQKRTDAEPDHCNEANTVGALELRSFRALTEKIIPSRLARDLIAQGYITEYFPLHISSFYQGLSSAQAKTFLMRSVDRGLADFDFQLTGDDVEAILRDRGISVLRERSMYNISLLTYLLQNQLEYADVIAGSLASGGELELDFLVQFFGTEEAPRTDLVSLLAPKMDTIFTFLAEASLEHQLKMELIDHAIGKVGIDQKFEVSNELISLVDLSYLDLPSITSQSSERSAENAVTFIGTIGAKISSVKGLSEDALRFLRPTRSYVLTLENMQLVADTDNLALDRVDGIEPELANYILEYLGEYLDEVAFSTSTLYTIEDENKFIEILNRPGSWTSDSYMRVINFAHPDCHVTELSTVPPTAWPTLIADKRAPLTFQNVKEYLAKFGEIDDSIAPALDDAREVIKTDAYGEDERLSLAINIINVHPDLISAQSRVALAASLTSGPIDPDQIEPEHGKLIGCLLESSLIEDSESAFQKALMPDWDTLEFAISKSTNYESFISPLTLNSEFLVDFMRSDVTSPTMRVTVLSQLSEFPTIDDELYDAVAHCMVQGSIPIDHRNIRLVVNNGTSLAAIIGVLARADEHLHDEEFIEILGNLSEPYSTIASKGRKKPLVPKDEDHEAILKRLKRSDIVTNYSDEGTQFRVYRRHGKQN